MSDYVNWIVFNPITQGLINSPQKIIDLFNTENTHNQIKRVIEKPPVSMLILPSYTRWFIRVAGVSGAIAVALGAYGSHVLKEKNETPVELREVFDIANKYHFLHTLALIAVPFCRKPKITGPLIMAGTLIFSGTCYAYALTANRAYRKFTPYGGTLLILGWLSFIL